MAENVIVMRTETLRREVRYSVVRDGAVLWNKTIQFSPRCPPAGAAFMQAAREQERFAYGLTAPNEPEPHYLSHAAAAAQIGVTKNTIYRWEKLKLIKPPLRDRNGHRLFTPELIEEIKSLKNAAWRYAMDNLTTNGHNADNCPRCPRSQTADNPTLQSEKLEPPDRVWLTRKEISGHQTWVQASGHDDGEYEYVRVPVAAPQGTSRSALSLKELGSIHRNIAASFDAAPSPASSPVHTLLLNDGVAEHNTIAAATPTPVEQEQEIRALCAERVANAARLLCEELQEDAEGVPQLQLSGLNAALDAWEAYPDARESFDDSQPVLAVLTSLVEDQHATDHQRRVARLALTALQNYEDETGKEIRRWQDAIRDKMISMGVPDSKIDGAGCDSGDPLDFTLAEIGQGVGYFIDQLDELRAPSPSVREAAEAAAHEFFFSGSVPKTTEHAIEHLAAIIAKHCSPVSAAGGDEDDRPSCWHCGVVLAYAPKLRCEDCPDECDTENCEEIGCRPSLT